MTLKNYLQMPCGVARGEFTWISEWGVRWKCRLGTEWALRLDIGPELRNLEVEHRTPVKPRWADWETPWRWLVGDARQGAAHGRHRCSGHHAPWRPGWGRHHCHQRTRQMNLAVKEASLHITVWKMNISVMELKNGLESKYLYQNDARIILVCLLIFETIGHI